MTLSDSEWSDAVIVGPGDVRDCNEDNILPLPAKDLQEIRDWLQPTPYDRERSEFSRHLDSYLAGTCQWLISTKTYQRWHQGNQNGILWIKGIPGSGKSVMAASIINQLRKEDVPVLFFFFRQIIDANHQPVGALRDWLCQILPFSPPLQVRLQKEYLEKRRSVDSLAISDLLKDIKFALSTFTKAYCVTDALDEMDQGNDDFIQALAELGQWRPANFKVLIFSRPVVAVEAPLRPFSVPSLRLEEQLVDKDIAAYVQFRLHNSSVPREYWTLITEAVPGRANGLFLYARLSMDAFTKPGAEPREVLEKLPADLNMMYNDLLHEHARRSSVPEELQLLILQSITHATRPLRLLELAEMIKATHAPLQNCSLKEIKGLVRAACGPLLQILHDETVSVVHHSFTEFLKGLTRSTMKDDSNYPILEAGPTNQRLAIACLDYLTSGCLDKIEVKRRSNTAYESKKTQQSEFRLQFPFLEYAATKWYIHTRRAAKAGMDLSSFNAVLDSFFESKQRFFAWLDIDWPENSIKGLTPLHAAAQTGLYLYAAHLFQQGGVDPNVKSHHDDSPLYWAASSGHADVAQLLIDNGADPDGEAHEGYKPLHAAALNNRAEVVKVLLAAGVNPLTPKTGETPGRMCGNAPTSRGHTPLMYACKYGHTDALAEFLPYVTDPETATSALCWSAESGHAAGVDLILQNDIVSANSTRYGETPLFKACMSGDLATIKVLLAAGADPNILCPYPMDEFGGMGSNHRRWGQFNKKKVDESRGYTALHALVGIPGQLDSRRSPLECLSVLLQAGANVHLKCPDGETALHLACAKNIDYVKPLLEAGADPYIQTDSGATILDTNGAKDQELLPILFSSGLVDINKIMTESKGRPLFTRLQGHHPKSALEFLKYPLDLNVTAADGNGFLHVLVKNYSSSFDDTVVGALLAAGADPNLQNAAGESPLHVMTSSPKVEMVSKLLEAGADLEIRDKQGQTPLFKNVLHASSIKKHRLCEILIQLGARLDTRDNKGRTLLHQAIRNVDFLDELTGLMKFDPAVVDNKGNTLFHEAASNSNPYGNFSIYKHLKKLGVDIDQPNNHGKTVLHKICSRTPEYSAPAKQTGFEYVIQECKNPSPRDIDGVQPLHIAAAVSEIYVFKLLNAGADIFGATNEGMTVLHVAARARRPGVISLVLSKIADMDDEKRKHFINQRNIEGNAALHYACASGQPETVEVLLAAGADPNLPGRDGQSPLRACVEYEAEQARWKRIGRQNNAKAIKIASIWLGARSMPPAAEDSEKTQRRPYYVAQELDSTRLDEILISLVRHGAIVTGDNGALRDAFHAAVSNQRDYAAECLVRLQSLLFPDVNLLEGSDGEDFSLCKSRLEDKRCSLRKEAAEHKSLERRGAQATHLVKLLRLHQYGLLEEMMRDIDILMLDRSFVSLLHCLVDAGLSILLDKFCSPAAALKFDDHEWCAQARADHSLCQRDPKSLLIAACNRELPNMEVVRILVEKMGVNINIQCKEENWATRKPTLTNGVLHGLVEGRSWWHVHEALPYLIGKGADLELRNDRGETPLLFALDRNKYKGVFYKDAARILLENGADVNAVNSKGETCLSKAGTELELVTLLLAHGAEISPAAIFSAIELGNVELLRLFLSSSQSNLANMRRPPHPAVEGMDRFVEIRTPCEESYPLFHAATFEPSGLEIVEREQFNSLRTPMMNVLLEHGADPYATFVMLNRVNDDSLDQSDDLSDLEELGGLSTEPKWKWEPQTCTVIHEIFNTGKVVEPLLQLPSLQLEKRDDRGRTLLLSTKEPNRIQALVERGADITAQDNSGKTVVHNIICGMRDEQSLLTLETLLTKEPKLVHTGDELGDTPLHYVLRESSIHLKYVNLLLAHGADPLQPDSDGNTALHFFAVGPTKRKTSIEKFLSLGLDINSRNKQGDTPVARYLANHPLVDRGFGFGIDPDEHDDGLSFFKELGADFFTLNNAGTSLLHIVAGRKVGERLTFIPDYELQKSTEKLVGWFNFLMKLGLDPMLEDAQQRTSLDFAAACGNEHILKLFKPNALE